MNHSQFRGLAPAGGREGTKAAVGQLVPRGLFDVYGSHSHPTILINRSMVFEGGGGGVTEYGGSFNLMEVQEEDC